jgi:hypothetical protein
MRDVVYSLRPPETLVDVATWHLPAYFDAPQTAFHDDPEPFLQSNKFAETTATSKTINPDYDGTMHQKGRLGDMEASLFWLLLVTRSANHHMSETKLHINYIAA